MKKVDYAAMSDQELKQYFLQNREDKMAMQAYFSRVEARPHRLVTTLDDPDFSDKIKASIERQLGLNNHGDAGV
jgi:hypothetical protein